MQLDEFRAGVEEETKALVSDDFFPFITETSVVPAIDDPDITYPNLVTNIQRVKLLEG